MRHPALLPLIAIVLGVLTAAVVPAPAGRLSLVPAMLLFGATCVTFAVRPRMFLALAALAFACGAWVLGSAANRSATRPSLLEAYARLPRASAPVSLEGRLREDASIGASGTVTLALDALALGGSSGSARDHPRPVTGGIIASVTGSIGAARLHEWRAGRVIRAPVALREPTVYRNPGVRDERLALARRNVHLFASIKSGVLIEVVRHGGWWAERAADVRAWVREVEGKAVGRWTPQSAALVIAILIGDRAGLGSEVEQRLQEAGTYHVIAISGGNIAILVAFLLGITRLAGIGPRFAAWLTIVLLVAYASLVIGGASVHRATLMAVIWLAALSHDVRGRPVNTLLATACVLLSVAPVSIYDVAFALTFGATLGILVVSARWSNRAPRHRWLRAPAALLLASAAAELALLPVGAWAFSRVTFAGLLLNFLAIPLMAVAQLSGLAVLPLSIVSLSLANAAGAIAHLGAAGLVWSASLVEVAPMLSWRVPRPAATVVLLYYLALLLVLAAPRLRLSRSVQKALRGAGLAALVGATVAILWSPAARWRGSRPTGLLRVTVLDVGQADSILVRFPDARAWLIDTGGSRAGGSFDIGGRVIAPVLWHYGVFRLDRLVLTHGDPDHRGGALAVLRDFPVHELWEGVDVPRDEGVQRVRREAVMRGAVARFARTGEQHDVAGTSVRVWHPPPPDWERQKVRNDDSIVLEVLFGEVSILLAGDISKDVERELSTHLAGRSFAVLKVPHHGSAGSSSPPFLAAVRPAVAIFTVGAGGQASPSLASVVARYVSLGATVLKSAEDGAVNVETDGREVVVTTFNGRSFRLPSGGPTPLPSRRAWPPATTGRAPGTAVRAP